MTYRAFVKYLIPSMITMVMVSMYSSIDTLFLGKFVSSQAMASVNMVIPYTNVMWGIAVMVASGACAYAGIKMGEQNQHAANEYFTLGIVLLLMMSGITLLASIIGMDALLALFEVPPSLYEHARIYLWMLVGSAPFLMYKLYFEYSLRLIHASKIAMITSISGIILNIIFDILFIIIIPLGVVGACIATTLSIILPLLYNVYYLLKRHKQLQLTSIHNVIRKSKAILYNGSSELFVEISAAIITFFSNILLLRYSGEVGVAAMAILTTLYYAIIGIYVGIASGITPLISQGYGAVKYEQLRRYLKYTLYVLLMSIVVIVVGIFGFGKLIISAFTNETLLISYTYQALLIYVIGFIFIGFNIIISSIYTAIGNGRISLFLSILRSFVFVMIGLLILPHYYQDLGVFFSMPFAESCAILGSGLYYYKFYRLIKD